MNTTLKIVAALFLFGAVCSSATAQTLDVPIVEYADGDLDTCSPGRVAGLNKNGDGFLAVRSGPGTEYSKLDEIHNGDEVWIFDQRGQWVGVV